MRILITGANGFVGGHLAGTLKKKAEVTRFRGDVTEPRTYPSGKFDCIIHAAAKISHAKPVAQKEFFRVNREGTRKLLSGYPGTKMILISTTDVLRKKTSPYAQSKLAAEKLVRRNPANLVVRLPSVFGPGQKQDKLIPRLIRHYWLGGDCHIDNNQLREYIFVEDVALQISRLLGAAGVRRLQGFKIRNRRLDELFLAMKRGEKGFHFAPGEKEFFRKLRRTKDFLVRNPD